MIPSGMDLIKLEQKLAHYEGEDKIVSSKELAEQNIKTPLRNVPMLFIQWYFLPVISFFFSSLPALESHTRMLLGKKIEYKVTEKV